MAVVLSELHAGLRVEKDVRERHFLATGSLDENEVEAAAIAQLPLTENGIGQRKITVEPLDIERGYWEVTANYSRGGGVVIPEAGESEYEFEIGMETHHVTQSRATMAWYAPPGVDTAQIPDFDGAIGVSDDGIAGVDIMGPVSRFSETHHMPASVVTPAYRNRLHEIAFCMNQAPFRDFDAYEVLFVGARGGKRSSDEVWPVTFHFKVSKNVWKQQIGPFPEVKKAGWDYLWFHYQKQALVEEEVVKRVALQPAFAYVERLYRVADFFDLGIGE